MSDISSRVKEWVIAGTRLGLNGPMIRREVNERDWKSTYFTMKAGMHVEWPAPPIISNPINTDNDH